MTCVFILRTMRSTVRRKCAIEYLVSPILLLIALTGCTSTRTIDNSLESGMKFSKLRESESPWVFSVSWITPRSDPKSDNEVKRINDLRLKLVGKVLSVNDNAGKKIDGTSLADTLFYQDHESQLIKEWGVAFAPFGSKERAVQCSDEKFNLPNSGSESGSLPGYPLDFLQMKEFFPKVLVMRSNFTNRDFCEKTNSSNWKPDDAHWSHHFRVFSDQSFEVTNNDNFNVVKQYANAYYADVVLTAKNEWKILGKEVLNKNGKKEIELLDCSNAKVNLCPRRLKSKIPIGSLAPVSTDKLTASLYTYRSPNKDNQGWGDQLLVDAQINPAGEAEVSLLTMNRQPWNPIFHALRDYLIPGETLRDVGQSLISALSAQAGIALGANEANANDMLSIFETINKTTTKSVFAIDWGDHGARGIAATYSVSNLAPRHVYVEDCDGSRHAIPWAPNIALHSLLSISGHAPREPKNFVAARVTSMRKLKETNTFWVSTEGVVFEHASERKWVQLFPDDVIRFDSCCSFLVSDKP